jgi:nicotinate-nucleotide adenylyltransferase
MRQGILGGTFDPVHRGHLDVADAARAALALDRVVLVPARVPPHREPPHASAAHRFAMAALATEADPHLVVSDVEMDEAIPSYTFATLDRLADRGVEMTTVFFLTGADAFREIRTWRDFPALLDRCHFVVVSRPGCRVAELPDLLPELASRMRHAPCAVPDSPSIVLVDAPTAPVTATDVRQRVAAGASIADLVPAAVAAYIHKHRLYTTVPTKGLA